MAERKPRKERKKRHRKSPPQIDSLDRAAEGEREPSRDDDDDDDDAVRSVRSGGSLRRPRRLALGRPLADGERKWTVQQEMQLLKKRSSCLAHKWMHYRMAHFKSIIATLLGFPLVVLSGIATAAEYYSQLEDADTCASSEAQGRVLSTAGVLAMVFSTLVTILMAMVAWLKPAEAAEIHRQVSITYQALVDEIESEMANKEEEREDGRFFVHDIENKMEMLAQTAPTVPWFIMRNYTTDWADEREREIRIEPAQQEDLRSSTSRSFRLDRVDRKQQAPRAAADDDEFDLMENYRQRLQERLKQEQSASLQYQLQRAQDQEAES